MTRRAFPLASLLAATACAGAGARPAGDAGPLPCFACVDASLPGQARTTLGVSCAYGGVELSCHGAGAGGLTLGTADDFAQIVGVASTERPDMLRVSPGDPAASYLYLKLQGDGGIEGAAMPQGVSDPRLVALFGAWIEAGAPR